MTTKELAKIVERNIRNNPTPMTDTETGLVAIEIMSKVAEEEGVRWHWSAASQCRFYGGPRLTKDVDVVAAKELSLKSERQLGFGGERYHSKVGKKKFR